MLVRANVDVAGVLLSYDVDPDPATVLPTDITFDHLPDVDPGKYRWDGEKFVPVMSNIGFTPQGPDAWYAVYRLMRRIKRQNLMNLPAPCETWMEYYRKSFTADPPNEA